MHAKGIRQPDSKANQLQLKNTLHIGLQYARLAFPLAKWAGFLLGSAEVYFTNNLKLSCVPLVSSKKFASASRAGISLNQPELQPPAPSQPVANPPPKPRPLQPRSRSRSRRWSILATRFTPTSPLGLSRVFRMKADSYPQQSWKWNA